MIIDPHDDTLEKILNSMSPDALLTCRELAGRLNIKEKTIRKWRYLGFIPAIKIGRKTVRFRWRDAARCMREDRSKNQQSDAG
jgi:excisionase family DNA binding protein